MYRSASTGALAILVVLSAATPASADSVHPGTFTGEGFDACTAPSSATMNAWAASPYRALGIYFGGSNRACLQPNLTAAWVTQQTAAGWHLIPIYLDKQASCTLSTKPNRIDNTQAAAQGRVAAQDAVVQARAIGLARESVLTYDMEAYRTDDAACRAGVVAFISAWTARLHDYGYLSGFYSSMNSGIADMVANYNVAGFVRPDYVDFARWDQISTVSDPAIPATYWSPKRRIKQYRGDHVETWGGVAINIDNDVLDVAPLPATPFGDFTGNGWSDLLSRTSGGALSIHGGNGTTLQSPATFGSGWTTMNALVRIGDLNVDGREDVIAREASTGNVFFYPGTGSGLGTRKQVITGAGSMREITPIGDLTGNSYPDLLAVNPTDNGLYLYPGRAGVTFGSRVKIGTGWNTMSELAGVGDFDRDGLPDLVARLTSTGALYLYAGRPGNTFAARRQIGGGWGGLRGVTGVGDADRDGFTDVMAVTGAGVVFRWSGTGVGLRPAVQVATGFSTRSPVF